MEPIGPKRMLDQTTWLHGVSVNQILSWLQVTGTYDLRVGELRLGLGRDSRGLGAVATGGTGLALLLGWVGRVEPEHVGIVLWCHTVRSGLLPGGVLLSKGQTYVVPDGHDQDHGKAEGLVELGEAADLLEAVELVEDGVHIGAVLRGDVGGLGDALDTTR